MRKKLKGKFPCLSLLKRKNKKTSTLSGVFYLLNNQPPLAPPYPRRGRTLKGHFQCLKKRLG